LWPGSTEEDKLQQHDRQEHKEQMEGSCERVVGRAVRGLGRAIGGLGSPITWRGE
jgi:hypothetical protein